MFAAKLKADAFRLAFIVERQVDVHLLLPECLDEVEHIAMDCIGVLDCSGDFGNHSVLER
ncbi:hypothetical protein D3C76_1346170 [compost metagenome]